VGLQNSGKTTLLRRLVGKEDVIQDTMPTIGFNMEKVIKHSTTLKCWDVGFQPTMWERYCRGVNTIV
jgi:GTPase SAR1 family protein